MKYSREQLRAMAQHTLMAREALDSQYIELLVILAARTGLSVDECERQIVELAK